MGQLALKSSNTKSLLRSINKKSKLYKQYLHHRSNEKLLKYKTYKNKLTNLLRVAKRLYFENQIEVNKTNIKQTWRVLNKAICQNKKKKLTYPLVDDNGESIASTEKVANKFFKYLTNISPNLADKIAPASKSFQDFINSVPSDSLSTFSHVTAEEPHKDPPRTGGKERHSITCKSLCLRCRSLQKSTAHRHL